MNYLADPGGVFASDVHRRVCGHLHDEPQTIEALAERLGPDPHTPLSAEDIEALEPVLADLDESGYATEIKDGWKLTAGGLDALCAPVPGQED